MEYDTEKIDDDVLALLYLTAHRDHRDGPWRAWKGHDFEAMNRLCDRGFIGEPRGRSKSVVFTDEGLARARQLFEAKYARKI
jgi:hypothetical protein